jgi:hypothetical protein
MLRQTAELKPAGLKGLNRQVLSGFKEIVTAVGLFIRTGVHRINKPAKQVFGG